MKKSDRLRFYLPAAESPTFSNLQLQASSVSANVSPMTHLAVNMSGATLATPTLATRRRLSLTVSDGSPTPTKDTDMLDLTKMDCENETRLLKGAIKLANSNKEPGSLCRSRGFSRRINLNPPPKDENNESFSGKENCNSAMPGSIVSATQIFSPAKSPGPMRQRHPLEDYDPNSQDSGYSANFLDRDTGFRFTEPLGLPPRRHFVDQSPNKENSTSPRRSTIQINPPQLFHSLSCGSGSDSMDDGFIELDDIIDKHVEDANLPFGLNSLLNKPIIKDENIVNDSIFNDENTIQSSACNEERPRLSFHRSFSVGDNTTPNSSRARSCLFKPSNFLPSSKSIYKPSSPDEVSSSELVRSFKRPEPPCDNISPSHAKRRKSCSLQIISENVIATDSSSVGFDVNRQHMKLQRSYSETETTIMRALHRSSQEPDLIGDFTKPYLLPLIDGRHQDLKTISPDTLAELISGKFDETVVTYSIVDCRYPYEFDGGHISGAKNIYTKDQILKEFVEVTEMEPKCDTSSSATRKHIVVFHCEFSSERGPNLYRFLRNCDRDQNKECYPSLFYPELYLLEGGYKNFFLKHGHLCEPQAYRPMLHPDNEGELRHFRAKSKSWNCDTKSRLALRNNLKRLGL